MKCYPIFGNFSSVALAVLTMSCIFSMVEACEAIRSAEAAQLILKEFNSNPQPDKLLTKAEALFTAVRSLAPHVDYAVMAKKNLEGILRDANFLLKKPDMSPGDVPPTHIQQRYDEESPRRKCSIVADAKALLLVVAQLREEKLNEESGAIENARAIIVGRVEDWMKPKKPPLERLGSIIVLAESAQQLVESLPESDNHDYKTGLLNRLQKKTETIVEEARGFATNIGLVEMAQKNLDDIVKTVEFLGKKQKTTNSGVGVGFSMQQEYRHESDYDKNATALVANAKAFVLVATQLKEGVRERGDKASAGAGDVTDPDAEK